MTSSWMLRVRWLLSTQIVRLNLNPTQGESNQTSLNWSFIPFQTNRFLYLFHAWYDVKEDDATEDTDEIIAEPEEENLTE